MFSFLILSLVQSLSEAVFDLFPTYCFNTHTLRFTPSPSPKEQNPREKRPPPHIPLPHGTELSRAYFAINNATVTSLVLSTHRRWCVWSGRRTCRC